MSLFVKEIVVVCELFAFVFDESVAVLVEHGVQTIVTVSSVSINMEQWQQRFLSSFIFFSQYQ
jgi:hypothetical protein